MGGVFGKQKAEPGQRRACTETIHSGKIQQCSSKNCKNIICPNCVSPIQGLLYCMLCGMSKQADLMEIDEEQIKKSQIKGARSEFSVKMDTETGEIKGFEEFLNKLDR